jgi:hypothetical protein
METNTTVIIINESGAEKYEKNIYISEKSTAVTV